MKQFCVIGRDVSSFHKMGRTWSENQEDAVAHAKKLLVKNAKNEPGLRLFVVQVVQVVELDSPPITVRELRETDIK